jgi:hypothetical protein
VGIGISSISSGLPKAWTTAACIVFAIGDLLARRPPS